jgi:hypothetical protein
MCLGRLPDPAAALQPALPSKFPARGTRRFSSPSAAAGPTGPARLPRRTTLPEG